MALGKDKTLISKIGGGTLQLKALPSGSYEDVGYLAESEINDTTENEDVFDETGELVSNLEGNRTVTFTSSLLQVDVDTIGLIEGSRGITYDGRYQVKLANGEWQLWSLGNLEIVPNIATQFNNTVRTMSIELRLLKGATTGLYYAIAETANDPPLSGDWPDAS